MIYGKLLNILYDTQPTECGKQITEEILLKTTNESQNFRKNISGERLIGLEFVEIKEKHEAVNRSFSLKK